MYNKNKINTIATRKPQYLEFVIVQKNLIRAKQSQSKKIYISGWAIHMSATQDIHVLFNKKTMRH